MENNERYEITAKTLGELAKILVEELIEDLPELEKLLIKSRSRGLEMGGKTEIMVDNAP